MRTQNEAIGTPKMIATYKRACVLLPHTAAASPRAGPMVRFPFGGCFESCIRCLRPRRKYGSFLIAIRNVVSMLARVCYTQQQHEQLQQY